MHPSLKRTIAIAISLGIFAFPLQANAQSKPAAANLKPATADELAVYTAIAFVNICALASNGVGMKKSMPAAVESVAMVLAQKHGSKISNLPNELTPQQLRNGVATELVLRVKNGCYDSLSAEDKKELDKNVKTIEDSMKNRQ